MQFTRGDKYHVVSDCGRYTVNIATQKPGRKVYMAVYRNKILGTWPCEDEPGDRAAARDAAFEACRAHAKGIA